MGIYPWYLPVISPWYLPIWVFTPGIYPYGCSVMALYQLAMHVVPNGRAHFGTGPRVLTVLSSFFPRLMIQVVGCRAEGEGLRV